MSKPILRKRGWPASQPKRGFTLLEVLVAMAVMAIMLLAVFQSFSSTLLINQATDDLWRVMGFAEGELAQWERGPRPSPSVSQGVYPPGHPMAATRWRKEVRDESPFPGMTVRKLLLRLEWDSGGSVRSYETFVYLPPPPLPLGGF